MNNLRRLARSFPVLLLSVLTLSMMQPSAYAQTPLDYRIVGVYSSYNLYENFFVTDIPVGLLTHLNYASLDVSENGQCESPDEYADFEFEYPGDTRTDRLRGNIKQLQLLKQQYPGLQILITVGGWERSARFSTVATSQDSRVRFANSCVAFMRDYGFDGINIDWRYPVSGGVAAGSPEDSDNFVLLLADLRGQMEYWAERDSRRYLLTVDAPALPEQYINFNLPLMHPYLDWFNLTTYGYHGSWSEFASPHAPLFSNTRDPRGDIVAREYNVAATVDAYLDAGIPAEKLNVGIAFFAQAWQNVSPNQLFGLYNEADGVPRGTRDGGLLWWRDLADLLESNDYTKFFDMETQSSWMYSLNRRVAISYEDPESVRAKAAFVRGRGLGGVTLWQLSYDDSANTLLRAVTTGLTLPQPETTTQPGA